GRAAVRGRSAAPRARALPAAALGVQPPLPHTPPRDRHRVPHARGASRNRPLICQHRAAGEATVLHDAYETIGDPAAGPFLFTCEHAARRLPEWQPEPADLPLLDDHWGWDVGAADLTRELALRCGSGALLSRFSRLVCDPNRAPDEPSFVVREIAGHTLSWNRAVDEAERARRRARYFEPYHAAIDRALADRVAAGPEVRL